jgi:hypothetical protein
MTIAVLLARILWLEGHYGRAEELVAETVESAQREGESVSLAYALALAACPVAIWTGQLDLARERASLLMRCALEHSLVAWRGFAVAFKSLLDWHEAGRGGQPVLPASFRLGEHAWHLAELLATLHPAWADERMLERGDAGDAGWCQAELLRIRGERALAEGDEEAAEAWFTRSLEAAGRDGALAWELRTATSLARLWMAQGQRPRAFEMLRSSVGRLPEGPSSIDAREALSLLQASGMQPVCLTPSPRPTRRRARGTG